MVNGLAGDRAGAGLNCGFKPIMIVGVTIDKMKRIVETAAGNLRSFEKNTIFCGFMRNKAFCGELCGRQVENCTDELDALPCQQAGAKLGAREMLSVHQDHVISP
jgi:hypothetical protein